MHTIGSFIGPTEKVGPNSSAGHGSTARSEFGASRKSRGEFFNRSTSSLIAEARIALEPSQLNLASRVGRGELVKLRQEALQAIAREKPSSAATFRDQKGVGAWAFRLTYMFMFVFRFS